MSTVQGPAGTPEPTTPAPAAAEFVVDDSTVLPASARPAYLSVMPGGDAPATESSIPPEVYTR